MSSEQVAPILDRGFSRRGLLKGALVGGFGIAAIATVGCGESPQKNESGLKLEIKTNYAQMLAKDIDRAEDLYKDAKDWIGGFTISRWYRYDPAETAEEAVFEHLKGADLKAGDVVIIDRVSGEKTRTGASYSADQKPIARSIHLVIPREGKLRITDNPLTDQDSHWSGHLMFTDDFPQDVVGVQVGKRSRGNSTPAAKLFGADAVLQNSRDLEVVSVTLASTENPNSFEGGGVILIGYYARYYTSPAEGEFYKGTGLIIEPTKLRAPITLPKR